MLNEGRIVIDGKVRGIKAQVAHFDFSSHCGASQLREVVENLEGKPTVFAVHGAEGNCEKFAQWTKKKTALNAIAPKAGEHFAV